MLHLNFTSFLALAVRSLIAVSVVHYAVRYRFLDGIDCFLAKWAVDYGGGPAKALHMLKELALMLPDKGFAVFVQEERGPLWREDFHDAETAKAKAEQLALEEGLEFFVFSFNNYSEVARFYPNPLAGDVNSPLETQTASLGTGKDNRV
jgi:hypothetical protein